jgi:hypothetical protein
MFPEAGECSLQKACEKVASDYTAAVLVWEGEVEQVKADNKSLMAQARKAHNDAIRDANVRLEVRVQSSPAKKPLQPRSVRSTTKNKLTNSLPPPLSGT